MISETLVELSRWQFAISAMSHFLFIPLTLGLSVILALMESLYCLTANKTYHLACLCWGRIFAINFALALATRLAMIFQFGSVGSYFSYYVGDVFALPLALEMLTTFFVATSLFAVYYFGWQRLPKAQHLIVTWLMTIAINLSALLVLLACGWMQNPVGAVFNYLSFRIELTDFSLLLANPAFHAKALHTIAACYVTAAATVMGGSAWVWLTNQQAEQACRSFKVAAGLGVLAILVVGIGDATPEISNPAQKLKSAALHHQDLTPQLAEMETHIRQGIKAYALLQDLRDEHQDPQLKQDFRELSSELGYALLLKRWTEHVTAATDQQIKLAAIACLPNMPNLMFWINRGMIVIGVINFIWFVSGFWFIRGINTQTRWFMTLSLYLMPLTWFACVAGWYIAVGGMQPWAVAGLIPTFLSVSSGSVSDLVINLITFIVAYLALLVLGLWLMRDTLNRNAVTLATGVRS